MAEFCDEEFDDESFQNRNVVSSTQDTRCPDLDLDSVHSFSTNASLVTATSSLSSTPIGASSLYVPHRPDCLILHPNVPLIENLAPLRSYRTERDRLFVIDRPGTPALSNGHSVESEVPLRRSSLDDVYDYDEGLYNQRRSFCLSRSINGAFHGEVTPAYPPTAAPPSSPSQLYAVFLQRNNRASDFLYTDTRQQSYISSHLESNHSNLLHSRSIHQNEFRRDLRDYGRNSLRNLTNGRCRGDRLVDRRLVQRNQNFINYPHSMVRLKHHSGDQRETNGMNGYTEDDEGNHDCHILYHDSDQVLQGHPMASSVDHNGSLDRTDVPEANGVATLGPTIFQEEWPMHRALWMSGPSSIGEKDPLDGFGNDDTESIMSFSSSTATMSSRRSHSHQLGTKVEMVYSLLSMLGSCNKEDMSRTLLEMSNNQDSCIAMRQSGCLPLLIQLLHGSEREQLLSECTSDGVRLAVRDARRRASQALHNIVHAHPDDRRGRREARVLRLLEQIRDYSDYLRDLDCDEAELSHNENLGLHPGPAIAALMKLSFDEEHRHAMCQLGGLQAIAELIRADHEIHGNTSDQFCVTVRRYAGMALTNLTFGDGNNKALLCSMKPFMEAMVSQLHSPNEDLRQVTASVLRNLSWRADASSKQILREVGVVGILTKAAMEACKESTLKSILSALWNLSAHCSMNKADICSIEGALEFLVSTLTYKSASKTLSIVENGGGILRNISSHIAVREDYRAVLRKQRCLQTLLSHLKSPSLTIVSNACGTLWNLSARCQQDQEALWDMGAVGMLRNLVHSKHKMISMGSSAALKNLLAARPSGMSMGLSQFLENGHSVNGGTSNVPSLLVRKQRALEAELDENLAETCDNIDSPKTSPVPYCDTAKKFNFEPNGLSCIEQKPQYLSYLPGRMYHSINGQVGTPVQVPRSESKDSLGSTRSEPPHYKAQRERFRIFVNNNKGPLDSSIVQERSIENTSLRTESNSNVVLQLFRHIQNSMDATTGTESPTIVANDEKPPIRPTSLPPSKRGVWNVRSNSKFVENGLLQNGLPFSVQENGVTHSEVDLADDDTARNDSMSDSSHLLDISGNKRPVERLNITSQFVADDLHRFSTSNPDYFQVNSEQCNGTMGNYLHSGDQNETQKPKVVLRRKKQNELLASSLAYHRETSFDENGVDQTPLVASRCSSLSSLTSCFQNSARSSWVSDASQRTSIIISPSELPDSPCDEVPDDKPHLFQFTDKIPDGSVHGLVRPRPAWPSSISSLPSSDSLPSSLKRLSCESDVFANSSELTLTDQSEMTLETPTSARTPPGRPQNTPESPDRDPCSSSTESSNGQDHQVPIENGSQIKDHELIAACVRLGIPNNSGDYLHNNSKLRTKVNNLSTSLSYARSGIPVKSNNVRLTHSASNVSRPAVLMNCAAAPMGQESPPRTSSPRLVESYQNNTSSGAHTVCDDNDNHLFNPPTSHDSSVLNNKQSEQSTIQNFSTFLSKSKKIINSHNFDDSKSQNCLDVSPDLRDGDQNQVLLRNLNGASSMASSRTSNLLPKDFAFCKMTESARSKTKTAIPQIVRTSNPSFDAEQHPRQLQITSQHLPIYVGPAMDDDYTDQLDADQAANSTDENPSTDALSSRSLSPRDASDSNSDEDGAQAGAAFSQSTRALMRSSRPKSRKNKANRRSVEIRPAPSGHSSEDDNRNPVSLAVADTGFLAQASRLLSVQSSDCEEKGKEDERSKEKGLSRGVIPDLLEGATIYEAANGGLVFDIRSNGSARSNNGMTDSVELRRGALMIAAELEEGIDECTHSSASFDLENMKPPSCMGETSMTSSGLSDLLSNGNGCCINSGKSAVDRRRNIKRSKKLNGSQRFVLKSVRQAIGQSLGIPRSADSDRPLASSDSVENLSVKSSGTSDLLENINPPSLLEDMSLTNSCTSLNSISSDILESRSHSLADPRSNSEMYQRLNAAAAMVQVYSREFSNIMTGSMKSSCNSDYLDLVKPPSIFKDIAEVTMEDGTEVVSDPLVSDSEPEELPHDDEASVPSIDTVYSHKLQQLTKACEDEGSSENLNSSVDGDSLSIVDRKPPTAKRISNLALEPQNASRNTDDERESVGRGNNSIFDEDADSGLPDSLADSEKIDKLTPPPVRRGPRIVKPINRETVRQMQEKKNAEKNVVKYFRGRAPPNKPKNLLQQITSAKYGAFNKPPTTKTPTMVSGVRPTRTSALRASQNKQANIKPNNGRMSPRSFLSKPPVISRPISKPIRQNAPSSASMVSAGVALKSPSGETEVKRPDPPVKQRTFTKEDSFQKVPEIPSASIDLPQVNQSLGDDQNNNGKTYSSLSSLVKESKVISKRLSFSSAPVVEFTTESKKNLQRKISDPLHKRSGEITSITSSTSFQQERDGKKIGALSDKKSPSSYSLTGKVSTTGSRATSTNSLSSLSSSCLSGKKPSGQKEVASKISCLWKRSESSSSSANSPITDSSGAEKSIPSGPGCKSKVITPKSSFNRPNGVTPPNSSRNNNIQRSFTFEKIAEPISDTTVGRSGRARPASSVISTKTKPPFITNTTKIVLKPKPAPTVTPRPRGGARIVKPVTPQSKSTAITSKTLRQNSSRYDFKSRTLMSSAAPTCFFIGRDSYGSSSDAKVSIPLVTAPFVPATVTSEPELVVADPDEPKVELTDEVEDAADDDSDGSHKELMVQ